MDLRSGHPFWMVKNGLLADYPTLESHLLNEEVIIIGSGITGALVAHELCSAGFRCTMLDKRMLSSGSTWASTAQMNYEIDTPLHELAKQYGEPFAARVYEASVQSVHDLMEVFTQTGIEAEVERRPVLYLASDKKGRKEIEAEFAIRARHYLPSEFLDQAALQHQYGITRPAALYHTHAAQMDAYKAAAGLVAYHVRLGKLTVYTRTCVEELTATPAGVTLKTDTGLTLKARHVVCAAGYEAGKFLPKKVMSLHSTYALVTQPLKPEQLWKDRSLIWETARPYFYARTTSDNRLMIGGQDIPFKNPKLRDALLERKTEKLLVQCHELFPELHLQAEFTWCGTFSETEDGMPYMGLYPGMPNVYFALGYAGNGITYSLIAAQVIRNMLTGIPDYRTNLFGFER